MGHDVGQTCADIKREKYILMMVEDPPSVLCILSFIGDFLLHFDIYYCTQRRVCATIALYFCCKTMWRPPGRPMEADIFEIV